MIFTNLAFPREFDDNGAIQRIVIHHAAGTSTVEAIHKYHISKGWNGIAYHYVVDKDGSIYVGRPENAMGAGCTGYNYGAIHICFNGNYNKEQLSKAALKSGLRLLVDLMKKYPNAYPKQPSFLIFTLILMMVITPLYAKSVLLFLDTTAILCMKKN